MRSRVPARLVALLLGGTLLVGPGAGAPAAEGGTWLPTRAQQSADDAVGSVLAISIDGLNPTAIERLGPERTPHLHAFRDAGASTLDARTEYEMTVTLPNHTGMVTGRRVDRRTGGHGVTWNDDRRRPETVQAAARHRVSSVFSVVHDSGGSTALFASKAKFSLWKRSWRQDIDRTTINPDNHALVLALLQDLGANDRDFRFLHLSWPDHVGHDRGFMSRPYLRAVQHVDTLVGLVMDAVLSDPGLAATTAVVLTSDHGGRGREHSDATRLANYRVPFMVRGPGVLPGADLYELNPDYRDPGRARRSYAAGRQPVRNGMVANLALDLLDLDAVPGSEHNRRLTLDVTSEP